MFEIEIEQILFHTDNDSLKQYNITQNFESPVFGKKLRIIGTRVRWKFAATRPFSETNIFLSIIFDSDLKHTQRKGADFPSIKSVESHWLTRSDLIPIIYHHFSRLFSEKTFENRINGFEFVLLFCFD